MMRGKVGTHDRQLGNAVMIGVVAEVDEAKGVARVDAEGMRTDWLQWTGAAGPGVRTWSVPEVGSQVVIACPHGDVGQAVIMGSLFQNAHNAPGDRKSLHAAEFADGTRVEYDRDSHTITIDVGSGHVVVNCATAKVTASEKVTVDTPTAEFTGDVKVGGKVEAQGDITTPAEVKAGPIGLKAHKHMADGSPTSPSIP